MRVVKVKELEDCFDDSIMKEALFDEPIDRDFIYFWKNLGQVDYFPNFSKPFFKVQVPGKYFVKGIEGNQSVRLILYKNDPKRNLASFLEEIEKYEQQRVLQLK